MPTADPTSELLHDRTRTGIWIVLACNGLFALVDLGIDPERFGAAYVVKGLLGAFLLGMFLLLRGPHRPRRTLAVALGTVNVTFALFALGDVIKGHHETTPQLAVVCALTAAALLPWGLWPQLLTALLIEIGALWVLMLTGRPLDALIDPAATITVALGVSVYVAHEFSRYRRARSHAEAALARANQLKSEFVSTMSHELRTPLNVISGYLDMIDDPEWTDRPLALRRIRHANHQLLELIEATLDLNRLDAGRDEAVFERVCLDDLWQELATELADPSLRAAAHLSWHGTPDTVFATDRRKLKTIVKNLVGNALKFTAVGEVAVRYTATDATCEITVRDTGVGIPADHLPHIFEMFRQVDNTDQRAYGGVGLGLHIVQRFTAQLGGTVEVESTLGRGSIFTLRLPTTAPATPARAYAGA